MFKRILVPLGGSRFAEAALPVALGLAERWDAALDLVTVAAPDIPTEGTGAPGLVSGVELARKQARKYLESTEGRIRAGGFEGAVTWKMIPAGNIWRTLVSRTLEAGSDLVVMTTHGLGPLRRAWLGSTADGLIRHSPVPVLLVRPERAPEGTEDRDRSHPLTASTAHFARILFPLDGSKAGEDMLEIAAPLATEDSECLLLRAVPPFVPGGSPYHPHLVRQIESQVELKKSAGAYLGRVAERSPCRRAVTQVVTAPQPAVAILSAVTEGEVDLIAISTAGRGGASRFLLGSVADKVIRGSPVPVLVFRAGVEGPHEPD